MPLTLLPDPREITFSSLGNGELERGTAPVQQLCLATSSAPPQNIGGKLIMQNTFFFSLTQSLKININENIAKRRGPKPNNKPALNKRQESNRKAQRYVKWTLPWRPVGLTLNHSTYRKRQADLVQSLEEETKLLQETLLALQKDKIQLKEQNSRLGEMAASDKEHFSQPLPWNGPTSKTSDTAIANTAFYAPLNCQCGALSSTWLAFPPCNQYAAEEQTQHIDSQEPMISAVESNFACSGRSPLLTPPDDTLLMPSNCQYDAALAAWTADPQACQPSTDVQVDHITSKEVSTYSVSSWHL